MVDSVAALVPRAELEGEMGDAQMGMQARLMSQALRKLTSIVAKSKTCLIFINQLREKIGVMFGNPETTTGGRALKFYASIRLDIRRIASLKEGDVVIGSRAKVKVVKNKVAPPFREAEFDILYGEGISKEGDLLDLGVEHKVIEKSGAWYAIDGERMGQGRENARQFLKDNPDIRNEVDARMRKGLGLPVLEAVAESRPSREGRRPADAGEEEGLESDRRGARMRRRAERRVHVAVRERRRIAASRDAVGGSLTESALPFYAWEREGATSQNTSHLAVGSDASRSGTAASSPEGFRYLPDFLTADEERRLVTLFERLPFDEIRHARQGGAPLRAAVRLRLQVQQRDRTAHGAAAAVPRPVPRAGGRAHRPTEGRAGDGTRAALSARRRHRVAPRPPGLRTRGRRASRSWPPR